MASKNKCTGCKNYFPKDTLKIVPAGKFHSVDCLLDYAHNSTDKLLSTVRKLDKKEDNLSKQIFKASDIKLRKKAAQSAFNAYIRARDSKEPCISCQRHHSGQYHAGHFKTTKARSELKFNEDNCHKQCAPCNNNLSGNIEHYRPNLIKKIGLKRVEALDVHESIKWDCDTYRDIEILYKQKLKDLIRSK